MDISQKSKNILFSREEIAKRVKEIGAQITKDYEERVEERRLVVVSILKGSIPFTADLIREIKLPLQLDVLVASSYGSGTVSSGNVQLEYFSFRTLEGADVILVDDITDSGNTLKAIKEKISEMGPHSVACCTLLNKPARRTADINIEYVGFDIPDQFVIGYGLDFDQYYRELPDITYVEIEGE